MTEPDPQGWAVPDLELEFPPKPEYVRTARHAVGALARIHEIPEEVLEDIRLAVSEACTSSVLAGSDGSDAVAPSPTDPVRVTATAEGDRVLVEVLDPRAIAPREVTGAPTDIETGDLPFERALALPLIRGLVDELTITPIDGGGVRMRMVVGFHPSPE